MLVFHISNRHLNLVQLLGNLAVEVGFISFVRSDILKSEMDVSEGKLDSLYLVMAHHKDDLGRMIDNGRWVEIKGSEHPKIWTDRFSNILSVIY